MGGGGGELHSHGYMVGEVCQKENPLPFHPRRDCNDPRRRDKLQFFHSCIYDILKGFKYPREKILSLNHLKAKTVCLFCKRVQSIILKQMRLTFAGSKLVYFLCPTNAETACIADDNRR